jgi:predicted metal-dependent hydrolase
VQLELFRQNQASPVKPGLLQVGTRAIPLRVVRNQRARRYLLRVCSDGSARLTVPRGGSLPQAMQFARRNENWVARQLVRLASKPRPDSCLRLGDSLLLRGESLCIEAVDHGIAGQVRVGEEVIRAADTAGNLRPAVERHLRGVAARELPPRVRELASRHHLTVQRVTVRNQRTRWGPALAVAPFL